MSAIPLRPLNFGEILDLGFGLFRRDFRLYMPLALVGLVPTMVATGIPTSAETDPEAMLTDPGAGLLFFGLLAVGLLFSLMTWAALATAMDARMSDRRASVGSSYARALAMLPRLAAAALLAGAVLMLATLVVGIPVVAAVALATSSPSVVRTIVTVMVMIAIVVAVGGWWATHTFMLVPAMVVERRGPFGGLRRSFGLVRGSRMRAFFVFLVTWFITVVPGLAAYTLVGSTGALLASNPAETIGLVRYWAVQIVSLGFRSVTTPLWVACTMVLFADLRTRSEGTDLQAAAQAMAG